MGQSQDSEEREGEHGAGWAAARGVGRGEVTETAAGAPSLEGKTCVRRPRWGCSDSQLSEKEQYWEQGRMWSAVGPREAIYDTHLRSRLFLSMEDGKPSEDAPTG